jgi:mannitol/fructose-specific phosphotransferase system IIA component (Ntr-type)
MLTPDATPTLSPPVSSRGKMHKVIHAMIQLQDLLFAREQQEASMPGTRLINLDSAIQAMTQDLPVEISSHFMKMSKKGTLGIVPLSNGSCSGCGMVLPVSQYHAVRAADNLYRCSSCARFLYDAGPSPRRVSKKRPRGEPPTVGMARFSSVALMMPKLDAGERDGVIAEMARRMESEGFVDSAARLADESLRREAIVSTAVDNGLAFPHVRGVEGGGLTLALGLSRKGIKFGGPSKGLTRIVFFIVIPSAASAFYLKLLSGLTQTFRSEEARESLFGAETPSELWKTLAKATRTTVP